MQGPMKTFRYCWVSVTLGSVIAKFNCIIITKEWDFFFLSMSPWIVQSNKTWNSYYFSLWCLQKKRRWRSYLYITYANDVFAFIALSNFSVLPLSTIGFTMQFFSPFFEDILRNDATILFFNPWRNLSFLRTVSLSRYWFSLSFTSLLLLVIGFIIRLYFTLLKMVGVKTIDLIFCYSFPTHIRFLYNLFLIYLLF